MTRRGRSAPLARQDRTRIQPGVDVAAEKRAERLKVREQTDVSGPAQAWHERHIAKTVAIHDKRPQLR